MNAQTFRIRAAICTMTALLMLAGCSKKPHASSSAAIVIEPGVAFDQVRSGATMQQIIDAFGPPDESNGGELKYSNLGFTVNLKNNAVHTISCIDASTPGSTFKKSFAGRTKEGIGLGSSKEDIVGVYGQPTAVEPNLKAPDIEVLRYKTNGLFFMLKDGKVLNMAVIFQTQK